MNKYEDSYDMCIYNGIMDKIEFETDHGTMDRLEEITYLVERYGKGGSMMSKRLQEKRQEYKTVLEMRKAYIMVHKKE